MKRPVLLHRIFPEGCRKVSRNVVGTLCEKVLVIFCEKVLGIFCENVVGRCRNILPRRRAKDENILTSPVLMFH